MSRCVAIAAVWALVTTLDAAPVVAQSADRVCVQSEDALGGLVASELASMGLDVTQASQCPGDAPILVTAELATCRAVVRHRDGEELFTDESCGSEGRWLALEVAEAVRARSLVEHARSTPAPEPSRPRPTHLGRAFLGGGVSMLGSGPTPIGVAIVGADVLPVAPWAIGLELALPLAGGELDVVEGHAQLLPFSARLWTGVGARVEDLLDLTIGVGVGVSWLRASVVLAPGFAPAGSEWIVPWLSVPASVGIVLAEPWSLVVRGALDVFLHDLEVSFAGRAASGYGPVVGELSLVGAVSW